MIVALMKYPPIKTPLLVAAGIVVGGAASWLLTWHTMTEKLNSLYNQIRPVRVADALYPLINPLLTYDVPDGKQFKFDAALQNSLQSLVDRQTNRGAAQNISIYYRDLPQGRWVGINENMTYNPA